MTSLLPQYDLVIVGGGINGAGIARDASLRGLSVLLLEQNDIGSGTSSWSSRLIHGGLRYLEYGEIPLVFESLHERRRLRRIAPHLIKRLRLKIPVYESSRRGMFILRLGMITYDLLSIGKSIPHHRMLSRDEFLQQEPGVRADGLLGGASFFDAQLTFVERLVVENVVSAAQAGAHIRTYSPLIGITVARRKIQTVQFIDRPSGDEVEVRAKMVVNAAGPWVDRVLATVNRKMPKLMGGTKGSHVIVGRFEGAPKDAFYVEAVHDGRPIFIIPWNGQYLIGTTDTRYSGDPANAVASQAEADYLLAETNRLFPNAKLDDDAIHYAYAGIRPLPRHDKGPTSAITRKHVIKKHGRQARGLVSVIGGKITTYRNLAEQVVDFVAKALERDLRPCGTRRELLPGATEIEAARRQLATAASLSSSGVQRLLRVYGGRAAEILDMTAAEPELARCLDSNNTVLAAEVLYVIRQEFASQLTDIVHRRMMIGLRHDLGASLVDDVATIAGAELGWSGAEQARQREALAKHNLLLRVDAS